ncbi:MAG: stage 0 sporulation protein [Tenericutes bacterium]|nr:stage 0 sporulation protein [Mycoplasmatota bacterium]
MKKIGIEFKKNGKQYIFFDNDLNLAKGDNVIVETERGLQFGKVVSFLEDKKSNEKHAVIQRIATEKDEKQFKKNNEEAKNAMLKAQEFANDLSLDMKFIEATYTFDRKQLVFQFLADNRIDFRELAKLLASIYKTRIELRQVGVRDKAKEVSGIGSCGRKICCSCFLNDLDSVGIAQVKNQNLSLNPTKINGLCGRLLCCLKYEDDIYTENRKDMPNVGDKINNEYGSGKVVSVNIPSKKYSILTDDGDKIDIDIPFNNISNEKKHNK